MTAGKRLIWWGLRVIIHRCDATDGSILSIPLPASRKRGLGELSLVILATFDQRNPRCPRNFASPCRQRQIPSLIFQSKEVGNRFPLRRHPTRLPVWLYPLPGATADQ